MTTPEMIGKRFGRLKVISISHKTKDTIFLNCLCDCGKEKVVRRQHIASSKTTSCGCYHREQTIRASTTHGMAKTKTWHCWIGIKNRCYYPLSVRWKDYGGRGIKVCDRWRDSFENFINDMGECPENHSIDRIDVNGNYEPGNCRWATVDEQSNNRRSNILITIDGETKTLMKWCAFFGLRYSTVSCRYRKNMPLDQLFNTVNLKHPERNISV